MTMANIFDIDMELANRSGAASYDDGIEPDYAATTGLTAHRESLAAIKAEALASRTEEKKQKIYSAAEMENDYTIKHQDTINTLKEAANYVLPESIELDRYEVETDKSKDTYGQMFGLTDASSGNLHTGTGYLDSEGDFQSRAGKRNDFASLADGYTQIGDGVYSNKNAIWNNDTNEQLMESQTYLGKQTVHNDNDGAGDYQVIDGKKTAFNGQSAWLYAYEAKDGKIHNTSNEAEAIINSVKLGKAHGGLDDPSSRYIPGKESPEGFLYRVYGWEPGEYGVDLTKNLMKFKAPQQLVDAFEARVHGNIPIIESGQKTTNKSDSDMVDKLGGGSSEYYIPEEAGVMPWMNAEYNPDTKSWLEQEGYSNHKYKESEWSDLNGLRALGSGTMNLIGGVVKMITPDADDSKSNEEIAAMSDAGQVWEAVAAPGRLLNAWADDVLVKGADKITGYDNSGEKKGALEIRHGFSAFTNGDVLGGLASMASGVIETGGEVFAKSMPEMVAIGRIAKVFGAVKGASKLAKLKGLSAGIAFNVAKNANQTLDDRQALTGVAADVDTALGVVALEVVASTIDYGSFKFSITGGKLSFTDGKTILPWDDVFKEMGDHAILDTLKVLSKGTGRLTAAAAVESIQEPTTEVLRILGEVRGTPEYKDMSILEILQSPKILNRLKDSSALGMAGGAGGAVVTTGLDTSKELMDVRKDAINSKESEVLAANSRDAELNALTDMQLEEEIANKSVQGKALEELLNTDTETLESERTAPTKEQTNAQSVYNGRYSESEAADVEASGVAQELEDLLSTDAAGELNGILTSVFGPEIVKATPKETIDKVVETIGAVKEIPATMLLEIAEALGKGSNARAYYAEASKTRSERVVNGLEGDYTILHKNAQQLQTQIRKNKNRGTQVEVDTTKAEREVSRAADTAITDAQSTLETAQGREIGAQDEFLQSLAVVDSNSADKAQMGAQILADEKAGVVPTISGDTIAELDAKIDVDTAAYEAKNTTLRQAEAEVTEAKSTKKDKEAAKVVADKAVITKAKEKAIKVAKKALEVVKNSDIKKIVAEFDTMNTEDLGHFIDILQNKVVETTEDTAGKLNDKQRAKIISLASKEQAGRQRADAISRELIASKGAETVDTIMSKATATTKRVTDYHKAAKELEDTIINDPVAHADAVKMYNWRFGTDKTELTKDNVIELVASANAETTGMPDNTTYMLWQNADVQMLTEKGDVIATPGARTVLKRMQELELGYDKLTGTEHQSGGKRVKIDHAATTDMKTALINLHRQAEATKEELIDMKNAADAMVRDGVITEQVGKSMAKLRDRIKIVKESVATKATKEEAIKNAAKQKDKKAEKPGKRQDFEYATQSIDTELTTQEEAEVKARLDKIAAALGIKMC